MQLTGLLEALSHSSWAQRISARALNTRENQEELAVSASEGMWPSLLALMSESSSAPLLVVTATGREADDLVAALGSYLPAQSLEVFPSWETLPHERLSPRSDTVGQRLKVLRRLSQLRKQQEDLSDSLAVVVAPVRALIQPLVDGLGELKPVTLHQGDEPGFDATIKNLLGAAYSRADIVTKRGEVAVRGGIIDLFPPTLAHPVRVDFFGDEIESIREFSVADQRTISDSAPLESVLAPPCRELLISPKVMSRAAHLKDELPAAHTMLEKIAGGIAVEGMESLAPLLVDSMVPLVSHFPPGTKIVLCEPERVRSRAHDLEATNAEFLAAAWSGAAETSQAPLDISHLASSGDEELAQRLSSGDFQSLEEARATAHKAGLSWWQIGSFEQDENTATDIDVVSTASREPAAYRGDISAMTEFIAGRVRDGWRLSVVTEGHGPGQRLGELLRQSHIPVVHRESLDTEPEAGKISITTASAGRGFVLDEEKLALLTEADLLGRSSPRSTRDGRSLPTRRRRHPVDPLQLNQGDYVVHEQHGVGQFVELIQRSQGSGTARTTREYLVLEYAASKRGGGRDRLFVPTDQLDQISKYVGGETPQLSKMGGSDWASTKSRARKAVKEIAGELIRLYSARMASSGHAFSPDTSWQKELEDAFPYVETPDQLTTINEVKADMERSIPMDRLISGDVGYGKTEIAVRAAFKAVQDGKQVALLVPTTLLAQQHFETFSERFAGFPVRVKALSRFQSAKESRQIIEEVRKGEVDVLVGTHRILSQSVQFKDLGLVIIDEEQRFGVEHKEELKKMRTNVDVLAMSATPIPRTLEMSMTGIRETSTLATAPEERHPVLTYVGPYTDKQVSAAIRREIMREGQVFFVHNRVSSIDQTAARIRELVPEARVEVAHGQMSESRLEQLIVDFWEKKFDVLVCTTIIETGLDISNANTLIIDRADSFGLSQLHQLRGRVGRGRERAYAYFLYPSEKPLGETALERLKAVAAHNELGAGMQLAMKDLEIRGAGNLLGGEQSGHIAGVGFDLYLRLVGEAVADFRDQGSQEEKREVKIELPLNAHLPHEYVSGERLRLEMYRKLAAASSEEEIDDVVLELEDRYGQMPETVKNLIAVARFRVAASAAGVYEVMSLGNNIKFAPAELPESRLLRLGRMYPQAQVKKALGVIMVPRPQSARVGGKPLVDAQLLQWCQEFIQAIYVPINPEKS